MNTTANRFGSEESESNRPHVIVLGIAAVGLLLQLATTSRYGYFRDELYYLACSEHLSWGYVDQPPIIAFITWLERHLTGDSLLSLRFLPACAGALTIWLTGLLARRMGAGVYGQSVAALSTLIAGGLLAFFHLLTMNAFEILIWTAAAYVVLRIIQTGNERLWLWFGVLCGVGLENKWSILMFGFGIFFGIVFTEERRHLLRPGIWMGFAIAMLIWLPNIWWNVQHHWPFLELMSNIRRSGRDVSLNPLAFLGQQIIFMNPITAPVWISGAVWLLVGRDSNGRRSSQVLGWCFATVTAVLMILHGKAYYLWPAFPLVFAGGAVAMERAFTSRAAWLKPIYMALMIACGIVFVPMTIPVLSPEAFMNYSQKLHLLPPAIENQPVGPLGSQLYADMFGWQEMAEQTAKAYNSLSPELREKTGIAASNYGDAGAIDFFGPKLGLPKAISGHQTYWFWGPRQYTGESLLLLGERPRRIAELCKESQVVGHVEHPYSRRDEHFDIYWCRLNGDLQTIWPHAKHFN
jgi:4-amino-4-deoxy-L-arabinose transferase-like glycosyltransferase